MIVSMVVVPCPFLSLCSGVKRKGTATHTSGLKEKAIKMVYLVASIIAVIMTVCFIFRSMSEVMEVLLKGHLLVS